MTRLSIIVPVYNTVQYLSRCIESILNQTYQDFELLLIDDGSTDGSAEVCDAYARKNIRIRVIHKSNGGLASTRVIGVKASKGVYIGFVDSDDWVEAYMYEKLMRPFDRDYCVDISIGGHVVDELDGSINYPLKRSIAKGYAGWDALAQMFQAKTFVCSLCDKVYKKSLLNDERILKRWPESYGEDTFVNAHVFPNASYIAFQPVYGYHYCMHEASMMHQIFSKKNLAYFFIWDEIIEECVEKHFEVAKSIWGHMQSYGMIALREMHNRYDEFKEELPKIQQLLAKNMDIFGLHGEKSTQYKFSIWMKCHADLVSWKNDKIEQLRLFAKNQDDTRCYIYGAGAIAEQLTKILHEYNILFDGYVVSDLQRGKNVVQGNKIIEFTDTTEEKCRFFLALSEKNAGEVVPLLEQYGMQYLLIQDFLFCFLR